MPISGLVVSLTADPKLREQATSTIASDPRVEVGTTTTQQVAIVVETSSSVEDRQFWQWLNDLPGVCFVTVAFVGFEQSESANNSPVSQQLDSPLTNST